MWIENGWTLRSKSCGRKLYWSLSRKSHLQNGNQQYCLEQSKLSYWANKSDALKHDEANPKHHAKSQHVRTEFCFLVLLDWRAIQIRTWLIHQRILASSQTNYLPKSSMPHHPCETRARRLTVHLRVLAFFQLLRWSAETFGLLTKKSR